MAVIVTYEQGCGGNRVGVVEQFAEFDSVLSRTITILSLTVNSRPLLEASMNPSVLLSSGSGM